MTEHEQFKQYCLKRNITNISSDTSYDVFKDGYESVRNMLCSYHTQVLSIDMIHQYMELQNINYDAIIAIRPDTAMINDIDIPLHLENIKQRRYTASSKLSHPVKRRRIRVRGGHSGFGVSVVSSENAVIDTTDDIYTNTEAKNAKVNNNKEERIGVTSRRLITEYDHGDILPLMTSPLDIIDHNNYYMYNTDAIYIPDFQHWGGCNDRLAYGSPHVMFKYLQRGVYYRDHPNSHIVHGTNNGEQFTARYLLSNSITLLKSTVRVVRVRANGEVARNDLYNTGLMNVPTSEDLNRCITNMNILNFQLC